MKRLRSSRSGRRAVRLPRARLRAGLLAAALWTLCALFAAPGAAAQDVDLARIDAYIGDLLEDWQTPGLAVGIVKDDSLIFARGYGVRRLDGAPVDEHTLFAVASNSKAFTAAVLGMLVEEGRIDWDDRVIDHIPGFQMYDPWVTRDINIRDLLTHRSGLATFGGDHLWIGAPHGREEIIRRVRHLRPVAPFRAKYHYQNLMYLVAGQVVPAVTDSSWDEMVRDRIFAPLGMAESNTSVRELAGLANVASPHEVVGGELVPIAYDDVDGVGPAAAINSNVVDMARWMRLNLNGGVFEGRRVLGPGVVREMQSIQFPRSVSPWAGENLGQRFNGYGLGWAIWDYHGRKVVQHSGGLSGMISLQTLLPEEGLGVVVLTNFAPDAPTRAITYRIVDAVLGREERDWNATYVALREEGLAQRRAKEEQLREARVPGTAPSLPLERYVGTYTEAASGDAVVHLENGRLVFDYNPRHLGDLEHWHYDVFRVTWRHPIFDMDSRAFLTFELDDAGQVEGLVVTFYDPIRFERTGDEVQAQGS